MPTTIEIVDIAGLVKVASKGEGLGNQFLANIRETDAIIHVLRCFENDNIMHVDGSINPIRDKEIIDTELQLKDLETVEKKIQRIEKVAKAGNDKEAKKGYDVLCTYKSHLESGQSARSAPVAIEDKKYLSDCFLLTDKPVLYVCNVDEQALSLRERNSTFSNALTWSSLRTHEAHLAEREGYFADASIHKHELVREHEHLRELLPRGERRFR